MGSTRMFEACLTLPHDPREATLLADQLDSLARALREWPDDAWRTVAATATTAAGHADPARGSLFERLVLRTAPAALDPRQRQRALASAEATAAVLRVLWPEPSNRRAGADQRSDGDLLLAST